MTDPTLPVYRSTARYNILECLPENAAELVSWGAFTEAQTQDQMFYHAGLSVVRDIDNQMIVAIQDTTTVNAAYEVVPAV